MQGNTIRFRLNDDPVRGRVCAITYFPPLSRLGSPGSVYGFEETDFEKAIETVRGDLRYFNPRDEPISVELKDTNSGEGGKIARLFIDYSKNTGVQIRFI